MPRSSHYGTKAKQCNSCCVLHAHTYAMVGASVRNGWPAEASALRSLSEGFRAPELPANAQDHLPTLRAACRD